MAVGGRDVQRRGIRDLPATWGLLAVIAVMFVLEGGLGSGLGSAPLMRMVHLGAQVNGFVLKGQWWRIVTAMFLHFNYLHVALNGYSLFVMGELVEPALGTRRFLVVYLLGGVLGGLVSLVAYPLGEVLVGASGAIFGLLGATAVIAFSAEGPARRYLLRWLASILVLNLAFDVLDPSIALWDHVGGLVGGFLAAYMLGGVRRTAGEGSRLAAAAYIVVGVGLIAFATAHG